MFTGIIQHTGKVINVDRSGSNVQFIIESDISAGLKVDESLSHNGVCLTVESINGKTYQVTAVEETLEKTNAKHWKSGTNINLEQAMIMNSRLDGHIVQGHVDDVCICTNKNDRNGSWEFSFQFDPKFAPLMIEKGSVCLNGVSLTAYNVTGNEFSVSIIPYTWEHTNFNSLDVDDNVNIEFDILGKYVQRMMGLQKN